MKWFGRREAVALAGAAIVLIAAGHLGLTRALGAHPFWALKVVWVGLAAGVVIYGLSCLWSGGWWAKLVLAGIGLGASYGVASLGKARFAASFAEDFLAGRMWYFGWMAVSCFAFVVLALLMSRRE